MKTILGFLLLAALPCRARPAMELPVWVEESHAGSFYFLASLLPLEEPHTLILVDAHTDASGIAGSDEVRAAMRRGPTREQQTALFAEWRQTGRIQCFDWIEPLMPAPVASVLWLAAPLLPPSQLQELESQARSQLDAHQEALPRDCGPLAESYHAVDQRGLEAALACLEPDRPVVASVDLDYFAAMPDENLEAAMNQVLAPILRLPSLRALTFAISSPWQPSPQRAERLVFLALDAVLRVPRARLRFEPFASCGPDKSLKARELAARGAPVPVLDVHRCGPALRSLLAAHWRPEMTLTNSEKMTAWIAECRGDPYRPRLTIPGCLTSPDGDWRADSGNLEKMEAAVKPAPVGAAVHWQALVPSGSRSRMMDGPWPYAADAPRWLHWNVEPLGSGARLPLSRLRPLLNATTGSGTVRLRAEVIQDGESRFSETAVLRIRTAGTAGFRAALSEQFGLPYIFGSTFLTSVAPDGCRRSGAECTEGTDCANFVAAALRADGWRPDWGSTAALRKALVALPDNTAVPPGAADRGLILDFGPHAAALWEDRPPLGVLDDADLCAHQLEGLPEILTLAKLRHDRPAPRLFAVDPALAVGPRLILGGDVMAARTIGSRLLRGEAVLEPLRPWFREATAVVNLECAVPDIFSPKGFCAPAAAVSALHEVGVRAVSLANNHAGDAGPAGLEQTVRTLTAGGVAAFGHTAAGTVIELSGGMKITLFGWFDQGPVRASELAAEIRQAEHAVVLAHWGTEHDRIPTPEQRAAAREFINAGAKIIAGAGPHAVQPLEWINGVPVAWSLGNLVFDDRGPDAEWRRGALLDITFSSGGAVARGRLTEVPVAGAR